jgi:uncharacterized protein YbjT (DUF2867 family)
MIVGGGCRGRELARQMMGEGHAVRVTTRTEEGRAAIEAAGAECWIGTPDRLATLRGALDSVTILCWLLGSATGSPEELAALHSTRLELFLTQTIDTTVRGFLYEACGTSTPADELAAGEQIVRRLTERNSIPVSFLRGDPEDQSAWVAEAAAAVSGLLTRV